MRHRRADGGSRGHLRRCSTAKRFSLADCDGNAANGCEAFGGSCSTNCGDFGLTGAAADCEGLRRPGQRLGAGRDVATGLEAVDAGEQRRHRDVMARGLPGPGEGIEARPDVGRDAQVQHAGRVVTHALGVTHDGYSATRCDSVCYTCGMSPFPTPESQTPPVAPLTWDDDNPPAWDDDNPPAWDAPADAPAGAS